MKFCSKCGKQLDDAAVVCPGCGCAVGNMQSPVMPVQVSGVAVNTENENPTVARCALVFSFLLPIVGLILGIIGVVKYKTQKYKTQCIVAIPISIVVQIISIIVAVASWSSLYYYF